MRSGLAAALAALLLAGCVTEESLTGKVDYKSTVVLPSLEVPPDLTSPARDNRYIIPETGKTTATYSGYEAERREQRNPAGGAVLPEFDKLRIERAGTQRWLVVEDPPEKIWPVVKDFWQENGFLVKLELPEAGVMETDWAENRANIPQGGVRGLLGYVLDQIYSTSERDKFRTRLDRVADGKGTEVFISHRGMQEVYTTMRDPQSNAPGDTAWQPRPSDPDLEAEFLRRLMVRLGAQNERAKTLVAVGAPAAQAELKKLADGNEALMLADPFDRAWRRVGLALGRGTVEHLVVRQRVAVGPDHVRVDQRGPLPGTAVVHRPLHRLEGGDGITAVHFLDVQAREAGHELGNRTAGRVHLHRDGDRVAIVLDQEDHRQLEVGRAAERLPELTLAGGAVARGDEYDFITVRTQDAVGHPLDLRVAEPRLRRADRLQELRARRTGGADDVQLLVPEVRRHLPTARVRIVRSPDCGEEHLRGGHPQTETEGAVAVVGVEKVVGRAEHL